MNTLSPIPSTSLAGELLSSWEGEAHEAATDPDGYCDYEELDHQLQQVDYYREDLERAGDVLEVFVEEMRRGG